MVDPESGEVSQIIDEQCIAELPLNGRRFTDLALLMPGVTQDPRGLTSGSNGDLSYGGIRGYQNSFLVDGTDNNNSFFAQARGRYRAPYQFSNEVIKEFRVSSNGYSAELGRAGGAVFNVVTNSGGNHWHGIGFLLCARSRLRCAVGLREQQAQRAPASSLAGPLAGRCVKNRAFLYLGYDQHQLTVPSIMQFGNGASSVVPQPADYDRLDKDLVFAAAEQLNAMAGEYTTQMGGNAGFAKLDLNLSSKQLLFFRLEHVALLRHQQCVLRSRQPHHSLRGKQQWHRGRGDREPGGLVDQHLDQPAVDQSAGAVFARLAAVVRQLRRRRRSRSTTWWMALGAPACCHARRANISCTSPTL